MNDVDEVGTYKLRDELKNIFILLLKVLLDFVEACKDKFFEEGLRIRKIFHHFFGGNTG
jgi:hypothetical protein